MIIKQARAFVYWDGVSAVCYYSVRFKIINRLFIMPTNGDVSLLDLPPEIIYLIMRYDLRSAHQLGQTSRYLRRCYNTFTTQRSVLYAAMQRTIRTFDRNMLEHVLYHQPDKMFLLFQQLFENDHMCIYNFLDAYCDLQPEIIQHLRSRYGHEALVGPAAQLKHNIFVSAEKKQEWVRFIISVERFFTKQLPLTPIQREEIQRIFQVQLSSRYHIEPMQDSHEYLYVKQLSEIIRIVCRFSIPILIFVVGYGLLNCFAATDTILSHIFGISRHKGVESLIFAFLMLALYVTLILVFEISPKRQKRQLAEKIKALCVYIREGRLPQEPQPHISEYTPLLRDTGQLQEVVISRSDFMP